MNRPWLLALTAVLILGLFAPFPLLAEEALYTLGEPVEARSAQPNDALTVLLKDPTSQRVTPLALRASALTENTQALALPLEPGLVVIAEKIQTEHPGNQLLVWHARLSDKRLLLNRADVQRGKEGAVDSLNEVTLVRNNDNITGSIHYLGQLYQIMPLGRGEHVIIKIDQTQYPRDLEEPSDTSPHSHFSTPASSTLSIIRVMLLFTNEARKAWPDMEGQAALMFAEANQSMTNSNVPITYENAGAYHINYADIQGEAGYHQMLAELRSPTQATLGAPAYKLREQQRADLVVLVTKASGLCGLAYVNSSKSSAFSLTSCPTGNYVFAHEMGHNFGLSHNSEVSAGLYGDGYGYRQTRRAPFWRTIMSYDCAPPCPRVNYWSDPDRTFNSSPMGISGVNNSVRILNLRRDVIANFYPPVNGEPPAGQLDMPLDVESNQVFVAKAIASDPIGSPLSYRWSAPEFTPAYANTASVTLQAPAVTQDTPKTVSVEIANAYASTHLNQTLMVKAAVEPITAVMHIQPTVASGGQLPVSVDARSATGKRLTYVWSRPANLYSGLIGNNPSGVYTVAQVDKDTRTTLLVDVSDGTHHVKPSAAVLILATPVVPAPVARISGPVSVQASTPVNLVGSGSSGADLRYAWSAPGFTPNSSTQANPILMAPASAGTRTVSLVVTDGQARSASASHTLSVAPPSSTPCAPSWVASKVYAVANEKVSYDGYNYEVAHWTQNNRPDLNWVPTGSAKPWRRLGTCANAK